MTAPFEFKRLQDFPAGESITLLLYGKSGTGKTRLAGTLGDRVLYISGGEGEETLKSADFKRLHNANPILFDVIETISASGLPENAVALDKICEIIDNAIEKIPNEFDTIVIDDLSAIRKFAMLKALDVNQALGKSKTKREVLERFDVILPAVQDFGTEMNIVKWFIDTYISICKQHKKNFVILAHERMFYDKGKNIGDAPTIRKIAVAVTGQSFPDDIPALFDNVWHTEVIGGGEAVQFRIRTIGDEIITAKTRHGGTFNAIEIIKPETKLSDLFTRIKNSQPKGK